MPKRSQLSYNQLIYLCGLDEVKCPGSGESGGSADQEDCFTNNEGDAEISCSRECLGGCYKVNQPMACYACRNVWYRGVEGEVVCAESCPPSLLTVSILVFSSSFFISPDYIFLDFEFIVNM